MDLWSSEGYAGTSCIRMTVFIICLTHVSIEHIPSRASCRPRWTIRPMQDPLHSPPHPSSTQHPAVLTPSLLFKEQTSISAQAVSDDLITLACPLRIQLLLTVHQQFTIYSPNSAACGTALGDCLTALCAEPNNKT